MGPSSELPSELIQLLIQRSMRGRTVQLFISLICTQVIEARHHLVVDILCAKKQNATVLIDMTSPAHSAIDPAILYWGTPVVLITSENEDGSYNIGPMSSAWWLGRSCMLGLDGSSKTTQNILRTKQCVLNLPDDTMAAHVNELTGTTGTDPVPASKKKRGYASVQDKWAKAALRQAPADVVRPARIAECPVQMECGLLQAVGLRPDCQHPSGPDLALEVQVLRVYVADDLRMTGFLNRIDPDKWRPLIMSFQELYGLKTARSHTVCWVRFRKSCIEGCRLMVWRTSPAERAMRTN